MKIAIVYCCVTHGPKTADFAARFASSYHEHPPGIEHDVLVMCNGGPLPTEIGLLFAGLPALFVPRENDPGWDISAYLAAAHGPGAKYDFLLCLGETTYFHRAGWLKRIAEEWAKHGEGIYGCFSSHVLRPHLNTTAFATSPAMLRAYKRPVRNKRDRYQFEHGEESFWRQHYCQGKPALLVTWTEALGPRAWRNPPNIMWRGDQSNCLVWGRHVDMWFDAPPGQQQTLSVMADTPLQ